MDLEDEAWRRQPLEGRESQSSELTSWDGESAAASGRPAWRSALSRVWDWFYGLPIPAQTALCLGTLFFLFTVIESDADDAPGQGDARALSHDGFVQFDYSAKPQPISDEEIKKRLKQASRRSAQATTDASTAAVAGPNRAARGNRPLPKKATQEAHQATPNAQSAPPRSAGWYAPGGRIVARSEEAAEMSILPIGTRFMARLEVGVSSASPVEVVARVQGDVYEDKRLLMRKGDIILGRAIPSQDDERMMLNFNSARSGKRSLRFAGYAVGDGTPGVTAERHGMDPGQQGESNTADSFLNLARDLVGAAASERGPVGQSVDRNLVQKPFEDVQQQRRKQALVTLSLPAGLDFEVIVSG